MGTFSMDRKGSPKQTLASGLLSIQKVFKYKMMYHFCADERNRLLFGDNSTQQSSFSTTLKFCAGRREGKEKVPEAVHCT